MRYVDDVFAVVKRNEVVELLSTLNDQHENYKFIVERESGG